MLDAVTCLLLLGLRPQDRNNRSGHWASCGPCPQDPLAFHVSHLCESMGAPGILRRADYRLSTFWDTRPHTHACVCVPLSPGNHMWATCQDRPSRMTPVMKPNMTECGYIGSQGCRARCWQPWEGTTVTPSGWGVLSTSGESHKWELLKNHQNFTPKRASAVTSQQPSNPRASSPTTVWPLFLVPSFSRSLVNDIHSAGRGGERQAVTWRGGDPLLGLELKALCLCCGCVRLDRP